MLTAHDWNSRYLQQAGWTRSMRHFIFRRLELQPGQRILEIGCGTGAITSDLASSFQAEFFGLDINFSFVSLANSTDEKSRYTCGDAFALPYPRDCFDAIFCHFFLLWARDIPSIFREMQRVTKPGGTVAALAEPDYGGRIDFPDSLGELGQWQAFALGSQGANPNIGRRLMAEFLAAGFETVESGLMGGQWKPGFDKNGFDQEWKIIESDLSVMVSPARLQALRRMDEVAHHKGERILFVPTFYTVGKVNKS